MGSLENLYAFCLREKNQPGFPDQVVIDLPSASKKPIISLLGFREKLKYKKEGDKGIIMIPAALKASLRNEPALEFRISH